jgi:thymidylate synthase ThyX
MRHWSLEIDEQLNVQELSQRYAYLGEPINPDDDPNFFMILKELINIHFETKYSEYDSCIIYPFYIKQFRLQSKKDRQASYVIKMDDPTFTEAEKLAFKRNSESFKISQCSKWFDAVEEYRYFKNEGGAKEVLRTFLQEPMTQTVFSINGTVRCWIHYLQGRALKTTGTPQLEHEILARQILDLFMKSCPCLYELMMEGRLSTYQLRESTEQKTVTDQSEKKEG